MGVKEMGLLQEPEGAVMGRVNRGGGGKKTGGVVKKSGGVKGGQNIGPRNTGPRTNRPTRGLVFGPMRGENEMLASGKRLRVETASVGREGGVFMLERTRPNMKRLPLQVLGDECKAVGEEVADDGERDASGLMESPMEVGKSGGDQ